MYIKPLKKPCRVGRIYRWTKAITNQQLLRFYKPINMNCYLGKWLTVKHKPMAMLLAMVLATLAVSAQQTTAPANAGGGTNIATVVSVMAVAVLGLVIAILGHAVIGAKTVYEEKMKQEKEAASSHAAKVLVLLIGSSLMALAATAQTAGAANAAVTAVASDTIGGMSPTAFYLVVGVIVLELAVIIALVNLLKFLTGIQRTKVAKVKMAGAPSTFNIWWNKFNKSVAIEREKDIDLSHDYDGIRELDNSIPPWWTWTFVACFIFAIVYLWRYHVSETAPLQLQELQIAMQKADAEKDAYLKTAAKNVDENTVVMLDAAGIAAGQSTFKRNCITCHGANGEGNNVGPNLTDNYWLHNGGIKDIFKTVKYGWVEKGMQSWQGMLSATEIAEVSSYIKSISGTNIAGGKAPQGELYKEDAAPAATDSAKAVLPKADTVAAPKK
jgi:cytochrome c oxidase cbb3-type subunit III